jgi:hypothetical protein
VIAFATTEREVGNVDPVLPEACRSAQ